MVSSGWRESDGTGQPGMRHAGAVAGRGGSIGGGGSLPYVRENKRPPGKGVHETPARNAQNRPSTLAVCLSSPWPVARWPAGPRPFLPGRGPRPPQSSSMLPSVAYSRLSRTRYGARLASRQSASPYGIGRRFTGRPAITGSASLYSSLIQVSGQQSPAIAR